MSHATTTTTTTTTTDSLCHLDARKTLPYFKQETQYVDTIHRWVVFHVMDRHFYPLHHGGRHGVLVYHFWATCYLLSVFFFVGIDALDDFFENQELLLAQRSERIQRPSPS
eukprot:GEZU01043970.1.p3 GENE.GEZU01043970.1~~GEZU01043970.1.p3  ORF type:complete len:111 (-),score=8.00 GEZU01043970.1:612-944(-)